MGISDESGIGSRVSIQVVQVSHNLHLLAHLTLFRVVQSNHSIYVAPNPEQHFQDSASKSGSVLSISTGPHQVQSLYGQMPQEQDFHDS